jgi:ethanolamine utilization protein EutA
MSDADDKRDKKPGGHTLSDHLYGQNLVHAHDEDTDHDHDHDYDFENDDVPLEDNPLWRQDNVSLTTVGIDIGSSGTQVIFSRVHLRRLAEDLTSRY